MSQYAFALSSSAGLSAADMEASRERLEALARLLDSAVRVPGTNVRVGADALLNVIPGIGTLAAKSLSAYLIWEARRLGVPTGTMLRMIGHVGLDACIGAIPIVGWIGDAFYRANQRNMALLHAHLDGCRAPAAGGTQSSAAGPIIEGVAVRIEETGR